MTIIRKPDTTEYCATITPFVIDSDKTVEFEVKRNGQLILHEDYVPDRYRRIVIELGAFLRLSLWGRFPEGNNTSQDNQSATFEFYIDGKLEQTSKVYYSSYRVYPKGGFNVCPVKITTPEGVEYINTETDITVSAGGKEKVISVITLTTVDVSPSRVAKLLGISIDNLKTYTCSVRGTVYRYYLTGLLNKHQFRFLNWFDLPETATAYGDLTMASESKDDVAVMRGIERKFNTVARDTYTVQSGPLKFSAEYKLWQSLLNARQVQLLVDGEWLDIIVTKRKFDRHFNVTKLNGLEFSFQFANPIDNNLL